MFLKLYFIALPIFFALDMLWLGFVAKRFYHQQLGFLMAEKVNWVAALIFYFIFLGGIVYFALEPAVEKKDWSLALFRGALFGLMTYAAYDLTNLATLKDWPLAVTLVDLAWGTVLSSAVCGLAYFVSTKI